MRCGCRPLWRTSLTSPSAEEAVEHACPCCHAPAGMRCVGGSAGWLGPVPKMWAAIGELLGITRVAYVDVCPERLARPHLGRR